MQPRYLKVLACAAVLLSGWPLGAQALPSDGQILSMLTMRVEQQAWATGMVVGVTTPKGRRIIAYGTTSKAGNRKVDESTVYEIGEITTVFTALALADLSHHGKVTLFDPVARHLPRGTSLPHEDTRQILLVDLATHTAGLPLRPGNLVSVDPDNRYAGYGPSDLYRFLGEERPRHPIGSTYEFSYAGYGLLGVALSRAEGVDYDDLLVAHLLEPLKMHETRRDPTPGMKPHLAGGYAYDIESADLKPSSHWDFGRGLAGAGGYRSTAADLLTFLEAAIGLKKTPISADFALLTKTRRPGGQPPSTQTALGWNVLQKDAHEIVWKGGSVGGFRAFIGYDPATRTGVVALANAQTEAGADDIGLHLLDEKLPIDPRIPHRHVTTPVDSSVLEGYTGTYRYTKNGELVVTREAGRLYAQPTGQERMQLFPEGPHQFYLKNLEVEVTFEPGKDGKATAVVWHQGNRTERAARTR